VSWFRADQLQVVSIDTEKTQKWVGIVVELRAAIHHNLKLGEISSWFTSEATSIDLNPQLCMSVRRRDMPPIAKRARTDTADTVQHDTRVEGSSSSITISSELSAQEMLKKLSAAQKEAILLRVATYPEIRSLIDQDYKNYELKIAKKVMAEEALIRTYQDFVRRTCAEVECIDWQEEDPDELLEMAPDIIEDIQNSIKNFPRHVPKMQVLAQSKTPYLHCMSLE